MLLFESFDSKIARYLKILTLNAIGLGNKNNITNGIVFKKTHPINQETCGFCK